MAPERIRGEEGNSASDLWSLGMLLYVAVEGRSPLRRESVLATLAAVLDAPIPPPARIGPHAPVLAVMLSRDPAARPDATALDRMLAAAENAPAGPAAAGSRPPAGYQHQLLRHRRAAQNPRGVRLVAGALERVAASSRLRRGSDVLCTRSHHDLHMYCVLEEGNVS